jgi:hypothetical protein
MIRNLFALFSLLALLQSCSITKEVRSQRNLLSGTWILDEITYENNTGTFQATLFDDADAICFEGSQWFFRDNNSTGRYTLKQGSLCSGGDRLIRWSVIERSENYKSQFQFKFIDEKKKDIAGGMGYRLTIEELTETQLQMSDNLQVEGAPFRIIYNFTKTQ